jgi:hypothetical protein
MTASLDAMTSPADAAILIPDAEPPIPRWVARLEGVGASAQSVNVAKVPAWRALELLTQIA